MQSKGFKTKIYSHAHSLIQSHNHSAPRALQIEIADLNKELDEDRVANAAAAQREAEKLATVSERATKLADLTESKVLL